MIIQPAILQDGKIYTLPNPNRHLNIIRFMADLGLDLPIKGEQGFFTDDGRFLNRIEAAELALSLGQVKELKYNSKELFSEDLW